MWSQRVGKNYKFNTISMYILHNCLNKLDKVKCIMKKKKKEPKEVSFIVHTKDEQSKFMRTCTHT